MHTEQVVPIGAADSQDRLFPAERTGQHTARVRGEDRCQQHARKAQEHEHPLGRARVLAGHLERVGDVVDQDVLPGCNGVHGASDSLRLGQGRCGIGVKRLAHHEDVDLEDRLIAKNRAGGGCHVLEGRHDRLGENLGPDDHRVAHIYELLELFSLAAIEQRLRPRHVSDAADAYAEGLAQPRHAYLDSVTGPDRQRTGRLRAEKSCARFVGAVDDPDGRVVVQISLVEAEHAGRLGRPRLAHGERAGVEIDERQRFGSGNAWDLADLARQFLETEWFGGVRLEGHTDLTAGEARARAQRGDGLDRSVRHHVVRQRHLGIGSHGAQIEAELGLPLGERELTARIGHPRAGDGQRVGHVGKGRRRFVPNDDLIGGMGTLVRQYQRDVPALARLESRRSDLFGQPHLVAEGIAQDTLHVDRDRSDRTRGHGRRRTVDEEQDG